MKRNERGRALLSFSILPLSLPHWAALLLIGRLDSMTRATSPRLKLKAGSQQMSKKKKKVYVGVYKMCLSIPTHFLKETVGRYNGKCLCC